MFFDVSEDLVVGALTFPAGREESGLRLLPAAVTRLLLVSERVFETMGREGL